MSNKTYIQIHFITKHDENEMLIALLTDIGFTGFEEEQDHLKAFIPKDEFEKAALDTIIRIIPVEYSTSVIEDQNWNADWESSFDPVIVNDLVAIRAGFHQPIPGVKHEIVITPKMSFGTGHHATTFLMVEQMERLDLNEKTVLDFGTGTGILAILSEKMGARFVLAIDNDDWSIDNARENLATNDCERTMLEKAGSINVAGTYDVILANINLNVILSNLQAIADAIKPGSKALLSGFLKSDEATMLDAVSKHGLLPVSTSEKAGWVCLFVHKS